MRGNYAIFCPYLFDIHLATKHHFLFKLSNLHVMFSQEIWKSLHENQFIVQCLQISMQYTPDSIFVDF